MNGYDYSGKTPSFRPELTLVERGSPMGEYLRRFWHPVGLAADATATPKKVRVLAEDLILFRDGQGRAGLVHARCCHRGSDLYYGRGEEDGLRCCYHGWLFDVEGRCLDMPMEPGNGQKVRGKVRQPWYPVEERYGLIFAYMGPPEKKPLLPRFELLETLGEGEELQADDSNLGSGGYGVAPCNWLQHFENVVDPFHVPVLHQSFSGTQFVQQMGVKPEVTFSYFEQGVRTEQVRDLGDGTTLRRVTECLLPNIRVVPSPRLAEGATNGIGFVVPIDSTHFLVFNVARVPIGTDLNSVRSKPAGKDWRDLTAEERQRYPGDWEAQTSQGPITLHSVEHLASTDEGVAMLRRLLARQVKLVGEGGDPQGWTQSPGQELVGSASGNFMAAGRPADPAVTS
ncbi:Rieske (2Fe-2S) domain-containing protein [Caulobacter sp. AP07]|uniref:aromatic ring-hydroxylating dioxygenase subunit alpha n=1 Tax=Caulobacter sp. AP07 TaxID=1144304 RepID=UPI000271E8D1|nr:aromatic ring-hydroxylating dioxygenase subunit alpha [Caulobacter sp. AP07]EJL30780.1 Rieske (2Fe-2S) domain-containing protein [Caulobacter sp. AP07]